MVLESLCPPALIYTIFALVSIIGETIHGNYKASFIGFWVMVIMTTLLNYLCKSGLSTISWIIVFVPFILNTLIIVLILTSIESLFINKSLNLSNNTCDCSDPNCNDNNCKNKKNIPSPYYDNYNDSSVNTIQ